MGSLVGSIVICVELAIRALLASFFALNLLRDVNKKFKNVVSKNTFHIVSTGTAPQVLSSALQSSHGCRIGQTNKMQKLAMAKLSDPKWEK